MKRNDNEYSVDCGGKKLTCSVGYDIFINTRMCETDGDGDAIFIGPGGIQMGNSDIRMTMDGRITAAKASKTLHKLAATILRISIRPNLQMMELIGFRQIDSGTTTSESDPHTNFQNRRHRTPSRLSSESSESNWGVVQGCHCRGYEQLARTVEQCEHKGGNVCSQQNGEEIKNKKELGSDDEEKQGFTELAETVCKSSE